jgi:hypothetical protein
MTERVGLSVIELTQSDSCVRRERQLQWRKREDQQAPEQEQELRSEAESAHAVV